jgi:hypothetical protein
LGVGGCNANLCALCVPFDCAVPEYIEGQGRLCGWRNLGVVLEIGHRKAPVHALL